MNNLSLLDEYYVKARFPAGDERSKQMFHVVKFMVKKKIINEELTYQRFVNLIMQLRKAVFI